MKRFVLLAFCFLTFLCICEGLRGMKWTEDDTRIVRQKLRLIFANPDKGKHIDEYFENHPDRKDIYPKDTRLNAPRALRLAFHDCLNYADEELDDVITNGCDGCLNNIGMGEKPVELFGKGHVPDGSGGLTNNNGLLQSADVLEEIYQNKDFPAEGPSLAVSLSDAKKSRADLWSFAALVATEFGVEENNLACDGINRLSPGHIRINDEGCKIKWPREPRFKYGRIDCPVDDSLDRKFFTRKHEKHPNLHGNGPETAKFYKDSFGLDAEEAVALNSGAHSFGIFHRELSLMSYKWTQNQDYMINNELLRKLVDTPQYTTKWYNGREGSYLVTNATGQPGMNFWKVRQNGWTVSKGPFQWFHMLNACKDENAPCGKIPMGYEDPLAQSYSEEFETCCAGIKPGTGCHATQECHGQMRVGTALSSDVGFYFKFDRDMATGKPSGCAGLDNNPGWVDGSDRITAAHCGVEDTIVDGKPLFEYVEKLAKSQTRFFGRFIGALEKMLSTGGKTLRKANVPWFDYDRQL